MWYQYCTATGNSLLVILIVIYVVLQVRILYWLSHCYSYLFGTTSENYVLVKQVTISIIYLCGTNIVLHLGVLCVTVSVSKNNS